MGVSVFMTAMKIKIDRENEIKRCASKFSKYQSEGKPPLLDVSVFIIGMEMKIDRGTDKKK